MARDSYDLIFWNWIFLQIRHISHNSTSKYYYLNSRFKEIKIETWSRRQKRLHMAGPSHDCSLLFLHPPPWIPSPRSLNSDSGHSAGQGLRHWATPSQLSVLTQTRRTMCFPGPVHIYMSQKKQVWARSWGPRKRSSKQGFGSQTIFPLSVLHFSLGPSVDCVTHVSTQKLCPTLGGNYC